jgi:hypothetical protein
MTDPEGQASGGQESQGALALWVTGLLGQVGCVTAAVIVAALLLGLWLDQTLSTKPLFTLILLIGSVPVTIYAMVRIVLRGMQHVQPAATGTDAEVRSEEEGRGENP